MKRVFVGIGSNLGDPVRSVREAVDALAALPETVFDRCSALYRTPPWGDPNQPDFVNAVVEFATDLAPETLQGHLQRIEDAAGRERDPGRRWGPRSLDLDLLWYGGAGIDTTELTVPHPRMHERAFVLQPLCDLEPMLELPGHGRIDALLAGLDLSGIRRMSESEPATAELAP